LRLDARQERDRGPLSEASSARVAVAIIVITPVITAIIVANTISGNRLR
jgi:hypothetical protein